MLSGWFHQKQMGGSETKKSATVTRGSLGIGPVFLPDCGYSRVPTYLLPGDVLFDEGFTSELRRSEEYHVRRL